MEELTFHWTDFPEVFNVVGFTNNIKVWLRLSKSNGHVYTYAFIVISGLIYLASETFQIKVLVKIEGTVRVKYIFTPSAVVVFVITKHTTGLSVICNYKTYDWVERAIDYLT